MLTAHEYFQEMFPEYLRGTLEEKLTRDIGSHLRECQTCRERLENIRSVVEALGSSRASDPPSHYFTTVLPRVRQRLEGPRVKPFFGTPLLNRVGIPLVTLAVVVAFVLRFSGTNESSPSSTEGLRSVLKTMSADDLEQVLADHASRELLVNAPAGERLGETVPDQVLERDLAGRVLAQQLPEVIGLDELSEEEVNELLHRLGERTIL